MIIDTHAHLDNKQYIDDVDEVIKRSNDSGVGAILIPGASIRDLPRAVWLSEMYENVFFGVGVHPYDIDEYDEDILLKYINHKKCVAVGECGLDYYRLEDNSDSVIKKQKDIFIRQINIAKEYKKPLIVHIRDANNDSKEILLAHNAKDVGGVLHCYNASDILLELADFGFYFGIGGVLTFKNAKALPQILSKIPKEKLLIETDAPYLTPHPHRGTRNEPSYTTLIAKEISKVLDIDYEEVCKLTTNNAKFLFKEFYQIK